MKKLSILLSVSLLLTLGGCQKELEEENFAFRGDWDSPTYALQIYQNGSGVCNSNKLGVPLVCEGRVKIRNNKLIFTSTKDDSSMPRKKFDIDQRPTVDRSGATYMVLDGETFEKR